MMGIKRMFKACGLVLVLLVSVGRAGTRLSALPGRGEVFLNFGDDGAALVIERRDLSLGEGMNRVEFFWSGVGIDAESVRLGIPGDMGVRLLSAAYPPQKQGIVWEVSSGSARSVPVLISYELGNLTALNAYKLLADEGETSGRLQGFAVIRNFSGEDFERATAVMGGRQFEVSLKNGEVVRIKDMDAAGVPLEKEWTWDSRRLPWDPDQVRGNVGLAVTYEFENSKRDRLGEGVLPGGKVRVYLQQPGGSILLGEDAFGNLAVGEDAELYVGDSRDIEVRQQQMVNRQINVRRNKKGQIVLYDTDEVITAKVTNRKDTPAQVELVEHIEGQWEIEEANMEYEREDASTLEFEVELAGGESKELRLHFHRRNVRP